MSLLAKKITKTFGKQKALDDVSFDIKTGDIVGFLGPNGAGKSTMMKIITGYLTQTQGNVFVNGLNTRDNIHAIRKQIGYLPEHNPLYTDMYIKEYLRYAAKLYGFKSNLDKLVAESIELTGLGREQHKKIKQLSKGYKQRTGLAAALIHNPDVLILDEPTTGLDPNQIIEIRHLIQNVGKSKTVLLSTHIMQEAEALCNRIIIIDKGKIVTDQASGEIRETNSFDSVLRVEFNKQPDESELMNIQGVKSVEKDNKILKIIYSSENDIREKIFHYAVKSDLIILTMYKEKESIENVFKTLTN